MQTLESMQGHMELISRTVQLLERRLAMTEHQVTELRREFLLSAPTPAATAPAFPAASVSRPGAATAPPFGAFVPAPAVTAFWNAAGVAGDAAAAD